MNENSANRQPMPEAPPLQCGVGELQDWFKAMKVVDADVTRYAVGLTLEHLGRAGVSPQPELAGASDWSGFALYLSLTIGPLLDKTPEAGWLRALLSELVDFSLLNPSGSPENRLAELLAQFLRHGNYEQQQQFLALLPPKAGPAIALVETWKEDDRRRADQSGY